METFKKNDYAAAGIDKEFVQDNESSSTKRVLRGLHFQTNHTQGKLVRVTHGEVFDVAVDVRPNSDTFGQWVGVTLSSEKKNMFYIPEGFAHGFLVLSDTAEFVYKCTDVYDPTSEGGIPCLYDKCGIKSQITKKYGEPKLCHECRSKISTLAVDQELITILEKEFKSFRKPLFYRIIEFIKKKPVLSLLITIGSTIILNIIAAVIFELLKKLIF